MSTRQTLEHLDAFWASNLGCAVDDLHRPGITLLRNRGDFASYRGAYLLRWAEACLFTVPESLLRLVEGAIRGRAPDQIFDRGFLSTLFGSRVDRVIGPAYRGCADATDFHPVDARGTRLLAAEDAGALERLAAACAPEEWAHSGIDRMWPPTFGCYAGDTLAAAGMLLEESTRLRKVGIVTHPAYRRQGYGCAVVSAMTEHALADGGIGHYQTLLSNIGSVAIARALGYQQYATALAVRLLVD